MRLPRFRVLLSPGDSFDLGANERRERLCRHERREHGDDNHANRSFREPLNRTLAVADPRVEDHKSSDVKAEDGAVIKALRNREPDR